MLENVENTEICYDDFSIVIDDYLTIHRIEPEKITPSIWNDILIEISEKIYKPNKSMLMSRNSNYMYVYDYDKLERAYYAYKRLCYSHNQEIYKKGFENFCGIRSLQKLAVYQYQEQEEQIEGCLYDAEEQNSLASKQYNPDSEYIEKHLSESIYHGNALEPKQYTKYNHTPDNIDSKYIDNIEYANNIYNKYNNKTDINNNINNRCDSNILYVQDNDVVRRSGRWVTIDIGDLLEQINIDNEDSLERLMMQKDTHYMKYLPKLNKKHAYNVNTTESIGDTRHALTVQELPKLNG